MARRSIEPYSDRRLPDRLMRWIQVLRTRIATIPCFFQGAGTPETFITANTGDHYYDETNDTLYIKSTDGGNTGWLAIGGTATTGLIGKIVTNSFYNLDTTNSNIIYSAASWDYTNNRMLIGGTIALTGFVELADLYGGKIQQTATLPSSVIGSGQVDHILVNPNDDGIFVQIANELARAPIAGTPWTDISHAFSVTQFAIGTWEGGAVNQLIVAHFRQTGPVRDYAWTDDNGATWTQHDSGLNGSTARENVRTSQSRSHIAIVGGGARFVWSVADDLSAGASAWNLVDLSGIQAGIAADICWNADSSKAVIVYIDHSILVSSDGEDTWTLFDPDFNPFRKGSTTFGTLQRMLFTGSGWLFVNNQVAAYMPESDMTTFELVPMPHQIGTPNERGEVWDGEDIAFFMGSSAAEVKYLTRA